MNYSNYRISLDMHMSTSQALMRFNKNDNARKIVFVLNEDGKPYKLTSDCQAVFTAIKPDETRVMDACTINEDTGAIEYIIPVPDEEATPPVIPFTSAVGMFDAEIIVTGENDRVITTPRFTIEVRETVVSGIDLESVDQFNAFVSAYNGIREYTTRIQDLENVSENMSDIIEAFNDGDLKGEKGDKGDKGDTGDTGNDGVGIVSIFKSGTQDNVDTYTITLTNGSTYNFTVTNYDGSSITNLSNKIDSLEESKADVSDVNGIKALIPNQATSSNQLADKNFVNSSIGTNTSNYISDNGQPFSSLASLQAYSRTVTNNDYAFVTGIDDNGNTYFDRYKASVSGGSVSWAKEYRLNNSSFTANQWAAIESGLTSSDKTKLDGIEAGATQSKLVEVTYGVTTSNEIQAILDSGKIPTCLFNDVRYYHNNSNSAQHRFFSSYYLTNIYLYCYVDNSNWGTGSISVETTSNKETTLTPTSTTKYPSSKAVADYVAQHSGGGESKLVEVTYGVTTYDEVKAIVDSGKIPYINETEGLYFISRVLEASIRFAVVFNNTTYQIGVDVDNNWSKFTSVSENVSNKANTILPTSTTNYPSSKAVADYVAQHSGEASWGNITGTITNQTDLINLVNNHHDTSKQDVISDLSTIRSGASAGATALQPSALNEYATETYVNNHHDSTKQNTITSSNKLSYTLLKDTPTIPTVPTNISAFTNDSGYLTLSTLPIYNGGVQ